MTYETVVAWSQIAALFFFMGLFAGVLVYAFRPANQKGFEETARKALDLDEDAENGAGGEGA